MWMANEHLLSAALALPDHERLEFAEAQAASLPPVDRQPFDEARRALSRIKNLGSG